MGAETQVFGTLAVLLLFFIVLTGFLYLIPIPLWIAAWASNAYVGLLTLVGMRFRRVPPTTVVTARISAVKAGLHVPINDLEAHFLAGGDVVKVVNAMISADKANIPMPFQRAAAIDLAGRDVLEAVQMSVLPKVIETPRITAVARDGIQLIVVSRVTVRANIDRLVGGAVGLLCPTGKMFGQAVEGAPRGNAYTCTPAAASKHNIATTFIPTDREQVNTASCLTWSAGVQLQLVENTLPLRCKIQQSDRRFC